MENREWVEYFMAGMGLEETDQIIEGGNGEATILFETTIKRAGDDRRSPPPLVAFAMTACDNMLRVTSVLYHLGGTLRAARSTSRSIPLMSHDRYRWHARTGLALAESLLTGYYELYGMDTFSATRVLRIGSVMEPVTDFGGRLTMTLLPPLSTGGTVTFDDLLLVQMKRSLYYENVIYQIHTRPRSARGSHPHRMDGSKLCADVGEDNDLGRAIVAASSFSTYEFYSFPIGSVPCRNCGPVESVLHRRSGGVLCDKCYVAAMMYDNRDQMKFVKRCSICNQDSFSSCDNRAYQERCGVTGEYWAHPEASRECAYAAPDYEQRPAFRCGCGANHLYTGDEFFEGTPCGFMKEYLNKETGKETDKETDNDNRIDNHIDKEISDDQRFEHTGEFIDLIGRPGGREWIRRTQRPYEIWTDLADLAGEGEAEGEALCAAGRDEMVQQPPEGSDAVLAHDGHAATRLHREDS